MSSRSTQSYIGLKKSYVGLGCASSNITFFLSNITLCWTPCHPSFVWCTCYWLLLAFSIQQNRRFSQYFKLTLFSIICQTITRGDSLNFIQNPCKSIFIHFKVFQLQKYMILYLLLTATNTFRFRKIDGFCDISTYRLVWVIFN